MSAQEKAFWGLRVIRAARLRHLLTNDGAGDDQDYQP